MWCRFPGNLITSLCICVTYLVSYNWQTDYSHPGGFPHLLAAGKGVGQTTKEFAQDFPVRKLQIIKIRQNCWLLCTIHL